MSVYCLLESTDRRSFFACRNEVWRYDVKQFSTHGKRVAKFMLRGLPLGAALTAGTIGLELAFGIGQSHGHDDHGHAEGGHH